MPESYGARLRQQREERGIALATIAQQTRIKETLLEALERDDLSQWPSGFYRRAFFRAYARAINLNPDAAMREFLEVHPEPPEVDVMKAMASALERVDGPNRSAAALRGAVGSAIGSLSRLRRGPSNEPGSTADIPIAAPMTEQVRNVSEQHFGGIEYPPPPTHEHRPVLPVSTEPVFVPPELVATHANADAPSNAAFVSEPSVPLEVTAEPPPSGPSDAELLELARLCTEFGRAEHAGAVHPLLHEAAGLLKARGLIVWLWDSAAGQLMPALVCGYPQKLVAHLPMVTPDADNPTAAAFRSGQTQTVPQCQGTPGAVVAPLLTAIGCVGALAIELRRGTDHTACVTAMVTVLAAQLAQLVAMAVERPESVPTTPLAVGFAHSL